VSSIISVIQVHGPRSGEEVALGLEDLLLRELRQNMNPQPLKELQVKISPKRRVMAITLAASLERMCRKGQVIKKMSGEGRAQYVYSLDPRSRLHASTLRPDYKTESEIMQGAVIESIHQTPSVGVS
jgi:hypothetical protein